MGVVHKVKRAAAAAESQMNRSTASPPVSASSSPPISKYPRFGKRGAPQAFPSKLYEILEGENPDIVGWTPTGRGFEVRDHARLSSEVLGRFFKQDKFSSFQRQLNLYGFRKITKGSEAGSYQHPHFRRGERTTLLTIRRSTKASPVRVVPNSPAFQPTAQAAPLSSSTDASSSSSSPPSSSAVTINSNGESNNPRPATPSPPPAPVRGILPWPRPRGQASSPVISEAVRRVSMSAGNGENGDTLAAPLRCQAESAPRPADGHATENKRQPSDNRGANAGSWGVAQGRGGSYVDCMGAAPAPDKFRGEWKGGVRAPGTHVDSTATATNSVSGGMQHSVQSQSWREGATKSEHERTQGLDHRDVEVVGLLQRMAKEAQDSPSRQRSAAPTTGSATAPSSTSTSRSMSTSRWEGEGSHGQASAPPVEAPHSNPHPHAQFRMPRSPQGSGGAQHGKQLASTERLHDILNHERVDNAPRGAFPYAFGADGRVLGVSHQSRPRLPAPFPPAAPLESYHEPLRRGNGDMPASDRSGSTGHGHREQDRGPSFEAGPHTTVGRGGSVEGGGRPSFRYYDGVVEMDGFRRRGSGHWHGRERPYAVPPVSLPYNKYRGEENGKFGGAVGASVGSVQSEHSWAQHRQY